jgi:uncharacterized protein (TIGR03435 family)
LLCGEGRFLRWPNPGRLSVSNYTLHDLIQFAYVPNEIPIAGGPKWMNAAADSFDIEAQGPTGAARLQLAPKW